MKTNTNKPRASEQSEFETLDEAWNALVEARVEIARLRNRLGERPSQATLTMTMETCETCGDFVAETGACETCGESGFASAHGSTKYVPFTITVPELKPGQGVATRTINVPVRDSDGVEVLTPIAQFMIDHTKMQMMLTRLNEAVRELWGASGVLPFREVKATPDETARSASLISSNESSSATPDLRREPR